MKTIDTTRSALVTSALALVAWPATAAWAQGVVGPQASGSLSGGATQSGAVTTTVVVLSFPAAPSEAILPPPFPPVLVSLPSAPRPLTSSPLYPLSLFCFRTHSLLCCRARQKPIFRHCECNS